MILVGFPAATANEFVADEQTSFSRPPHPPSDCQGQSSAGHRDLQAERSRLDTGWTALEQERQQLSGQRRTESILAPAIQYLGGILLAVVLLGFCWRVLTTSHSGREDNGQLTELLMSEILPEEPSLLADDRHARLLDERTADNRALE